MLDKVWPQRRPGRAADLGPPRITCWADILK